VDVVRHNLLLVPAHPHGFHLRLRRYLDRVDIPVVAVLECMAGAMCYAVSSVLQQHAARVQPDDLSMRPGLILRLARSGRWMFGNLMDIGGFAFQFLALRHAALALVEPLFVVGLVFAIVGTALAAHRRPTRGEYWWSLLVAGGLALFVAAAEPGPGHPVASGTKWAALFVVTGIVVGGSTLIGVQHSRWRALSLGAATGILYGFTSAVTEYTGHLLNRGTFHALSTWAPYVLVVIGVLGLLLNQSAYHAGELRLSLPVITVAEPIVAIIIGQALFGEHIGSSALAITGEVIGLGLMTIGVVQLSRLSPVPSQLPA
jgi:hypothetical protein